MEGQFTIYGRLAGLNEIVKDARYSRFAGAIQKKKETQKCQWAIVAARVPHFKGAVLVAFRWFEKDYRRDPDNITAGSKFVLDALVTLGRLPNDSRKWIKGITHAFPEPDKVNPRIEVILTEVV